MSIKHHFLPNSNYDLENKIFKEISLNSISDLFSDIPNHLLLQQPLKLPDKMDELNLLQHCENLLSKNFVYPKKLCFLGGGAWPHYVPAAVDEITSRSEFYTSYTPYQPEISQGMLQALFEYQSLICDLTSMDVANSSMYDWTTAAGEAIRMILRITNKNKVLVSKNVGPERLNVIRTYCKNMSIKIETVDFNLETGQIDMNKLQSIGNDIAGLYVENPNFFGIIEDNVLEISNLIHEKGGMFVVGTDPSSLGLLKPPGQYGADIVVGEGQPIGLHMNGGGPYMGIFAIKKDPKLVRQMPGRIIGYTDSLQSNQPGYVMVMQTREQYIRRERATSNICTNEALMAIGVAVYLSLLGPEGIKQLSELILANSNYAIKQLSELPNISLPFSNNYLFKDFAININTKSCDTEKIFNNLDNLGILGGLPLKRYFNELNNTMLFSVTELHSKNDIDKLVESVREVSI